jgi:hypothetical protein
VLAPWTMTSFSLASFLAASTALRKSAQNVNGEFPFGTSAGGACASTTIDRPEPGANHRTRSQDRRCGVPLAARQLCGTWHPRNRDFAPADAENCLPDTGPVGPIHPEAIREVVWRWGRQTAVRRDVRTSNEAVHRECHVNNDFGHSTLPFTLLAMVGQTVRVPAVLV